MYVILIKIASISYYVSGGVCAPAYLAQTEETAGVKTNNSVSHFLCLFLSLAHTSSHKVAANRAENQNVIKSGVDPRQERDALVGHNFDHFWGQLYRPRRGRRFLDDVDCSCRRPRCCNYHISNRRTQAGRHHRQRKHSWEANYHAHSPSRVLLYRHYHHIRYLHYHLPRGPGHVPPGDPSDEFVYASQLRSSSHSGFFLRERIVWTGPRGDRGSDQEE